MLEIAPVDGNVARNPRNKTYVFISISILVVVIAGAVFLLRQSLTPCTTLDIALNRSGCTRVIKLPAFVVESLAAAPQENNLAMIGRYVGSEDLDPPVTVQVIVVNDGTVIDRYEFANEGAIPLIMFTPDGQQIERLEDHLPPLMGIGEVDFPDRETRASVTASNTLTVQNDDGVLYEFTMEDNFLHLVPLYVSGDGERLVAKFVASDYEDWIVAWDLTTGKRVIDLHWDAMSSGLAWLADNRTLAMGVWYSDSWDGGIALFDTSN